MFSSFTNNPISLPQPPSPYFTPHTFSFGQNHHDLDLLHHYFDLGHHPITSSTANSMMLLSSSKGIEMKREIPGPNYQDLSFRGGRLNSKPKGKQIQKKDRHCKIVTASGPRDRRVRLSMDIARQFFDLQDLLGFDKASKTIDWLLTESTTAINELVQMKQMEEHNAKNYSSLECKSYDNVGNSRSLFSLTNGEEILGQKSGIGFDSAAKELRAKARARARERTVEKKCKNEKMFDVLELPRKSCSHFGDVKTCDCELLCFCQPNGKSDFGETFESLAVITKKMKPSTVSSWDNLKMDSCIFNQGDSDLHEVFRGLQE